MRILGAVLTFAIMLPGVPSFAKGAKKYLTVTSRLKAHPPLESAPVYFQERNHGQTTIATLKNKDVNALDESVLEEAISLLAKLDADRDVKVVVLTGHGKNFAAGGDMNVMAKADADYARKIATLANDLMLMPPQMEKGVLAAVNGKAVGGGATLPLSADELIAARIRENGQPVGMIGHPELGLATIPGFGGIQWLVRRLGKPLAKKVISSGKLYTADEAQKMGWIDRVVEPEDLMTAAITRAEAYESKDPDAWSMLKHSVDEIYPNSSFLKSLENDIDNYARTFATGKPQRRMQEFLDRKKNQAKK